eukprot:15062495-Alexandrium_andersonii.AAC.1
MAQACTSTHDPSGAGKQPPALFSASRGGHPLAALAPVAIAGDRSPERLRAALLACDQARRPHSSMQL